MIDRQLENFKISKNFLMSQSCRPLTFRWFSFAPPMTRWGWIWFGCCGHIWVYRSSGRCKSKPHRSACSSCSDAADPPVLGRSRWCCSLSGCQPATGPKTVGRSPDRSAAAWSTSGVGWSETRSRSRCSIVFWGCRTGFGRWERELARD